MALIVHKRADGSLVVDPRSGELADRILLGATTLARWGVESGKSVTLTTADGDAVFTFAGFDPDLRQTKFPMMVYERVPADG